MTALSTVLEMESRVKQARILVCDDNPLNRELLVEMLDSLGHRCSTASDGDEALTLLTRESFDLVMLDCQMPGLDGYATARRRRALEDAQGTTPVPIIAVTANAAENDRAACLAAGMDDYLPKPFMLSDLEHAIARCLGVKGAHGDRSAAYAADEGADAPLIGHSSIDSMEIGEDRRNALKRRVYGMFLDGSEEKFAQMENALDGERYAEVRELAHYLKSSSANLGAASLAEILGGVQGCCDRGEYAGLPRMVMDARVLFDAVVVEMACRLADLSPDTPTR